MDDPTRQTPAVGEPASYRYLTSRHLTEASAHRVRIVQPWTRRGKLDAYGTEQSIRYVEAEATEVFGTVDSSELRAAYVSSVVAMAPPLTQDQIGHVTSLLRSESEDCE